MKNYESSNLISKFNLVLWNVEGLPNFYNMHTNHSMFDPKKNYFLCFVETFSAIPVTITNYYSYHSPASLQPVGQMGRPIGGVSVYVSKHAGAILDNVRKTDYVIVKCTFVTIICFYLNPDHNEIEIFNKVQEALNKCNVKENIVLVGDFNARSDERRGRNNHKFELLLSVATSASLSICNTDLNDPTYICKTRMSTIDHIFCNKSHMACNNIHTLNVSRKKHFPLSAEFVLLSEQQVNTNIARQSPYTHKIDLAQVQNIVMNTVRQYHTCYDMKNVEGLYDLFTHIIKNSAIPKKVYTRTSEPWFDRECFVLRKRVLTILLELRAVQFNDFDLLVHYHRERRVYRALTNEKVLNFNLRKEKDLIRQAEVEGCHKLLFQNSPQNKICCVSMPKLVAHFSKSYNTAKLSPSDSLNLHTILANYESPVPFYPISVDEVKRFIKLSKNKKATGPNYVSNEQLKASNEILCSHLCDLFNMCIETCLIPTDWRTSHLKVLYKGKGERSSPDSHRGIALSCNDFKLFGSILTARLSEFTDRVIPDEQFGFMRGRSTLQAVSSLFESVQEALEKQGGRKYVVYIDFKSAFDAVDRALLLKCLMDLNTIPIELLKVFATIFDVNFIRVHDGLTLSEAFTQSNGVLQGWPSSPLLYNVFTHDLPATISAATNDKAKCVMYADDLAISADDLPTLQLAMDALDPWCAQKKVAVNTEKTKLMIFRNGGPIPVSELKYKGKIIEYVTEFKELGIILQTRARSFTSHVKDRRGSALAAIAGIPRLKLVSIGTALKLFDLKIAPIASYGIQLIWPLLKQSDLMLLESVKAAYLKRAMCLYKKSQSRHVYLLAQTDYFVTELKERFHLPDTQSYLEFLDCQKQKVEEIDKDFYNSSAMIDRTWAQPEQKDRHVHTRFAVHGFHHHLCKNKEFHRATDMCKCELCEDVCGTYHAKVCKSKDVKSISAYAKM
jgi:hypothetical protein